MARADLGGYTWLAFQICLPLTLLLLFLFTCISYIFGVAFAFGLAEAFGLDLPAPSALAGCEGHGALG